MTGEDDPLPRFLEAQYASFDEDLPLWLALSAQQGSPILELGCGPGRLLFSLARAGFQLAGLDNHPGMLARAKSHLSQELAARVTLHLADLVEFSLDHTFNLAIVACNTFSQLDDGQAARALAAMARHLDPKGLVALDMPNPSSTLIETTQEGELLATFIEPETGHPIQVSACQQALSKGQKVQVIWLYDELFPDGHVERTELETIYHLRTAGCLEAMFSEADFCEVRFYGDYLFGPLAPSSERLLAVAQIWGS